MLANLQNMASSQFRWLAYSLNFTYINPEVFEYNAKITHHSFVILFQKISFFSQGRVKYFWNRILKAFLSIARTLLVGQLSEFDYGDILGDCLNTLQERYNSFAYLDLCVCCMIISLDIWLEVYRLYRPYTLLHDMWRNLSEHTLSKTFKYELFINIW